MIEEIKNKPNRLPTFIIIRFSFSIIRLNRHFVHFVTSYLIDDNITRE